MANRSEYFCLRPSNKKDLNKISSYIGFTSNTVPSAKNLYWNRVLNVLLITELEFVKLNT